MWQQLRLDTLDIQPIDIKCTEYRMFLKYLKFPGMSEFLPFCLLGSNA